MSFLDFIFFSRAKALKNMYFKPYIFAFFSEFLFLYSFYVSFFASNAFTGRQISMLIMTANIATMFFNIPAGIFADIISRKQLLFIGISAKISFCIMFLISRDFYSFLFAMSFYGIGNSCIYYHTEAYFYDFLKNKKKTAEYSKFMGLYYAVGNVAIALAGFTGEYVYVNKGFKGVFAGSIISLVIALCILCIMPDSRVNRGEQKVFNVNSSKNVLKLVSEVIKKPKIVRIIILSVILDSLFIVFLDLNTGLMNFMQIKAGTIAYVVGIVGVVRCFTNYLSGKTANKISFKTIHSLLLIMVIIGLFVSFLGGKYMVISISTYLCFYPFLDMAIKTKLQNNIDSFTRATVFSFVSILSFLLAGSLNLSISYIVGTNGYFSAPVFVYIAVIIMLFLVRHIISVYKTDKHIRGAVGSLRSHFKK